MGKSFENFGQPDINIDHHKTNENFGKLNLIEPEEVATAAILARHLPEWGYNITKPIAAALLTGIVTDTLGFPYIKHESFCFAFVCHVDGNGRGYDRALHEGSGE